MAIPAVLPMQDCLARPCNSECESLTSVARKPRMSGFFPNPNPNPKPNRTRRSKRSHVGSPDRNRGQDRELVAKFPSKNLVMGQVKILKRGEDLTMPPVTAKSNQRLGGDDLVSCSTDRLRPEPEMIQNQIRVPEIKLADGIYAGSAAFFASPPPSSLPLPVFFSKKQNNDAVTNNLRRLLRIDLV